MDKFVMLEAHCSSKQAHHGCISIYNAGFTCREYKLDISHNAVNDIHYGYNIFCAAPEGDRFRTLIMDTP